MAPAMMGLEVEHAPAAAGSGGGIPSSVVAETIMTVARKTLPHVRTLDEAGMFLPSGGRFYLDHGGHPEWTTPECTNPWDAVRYLEAGDRWLLKLAAAAGKALGGAQVSLYGRNVDYSDHDASWGCHESYLHHTDPRLFRVHLIPHLASRIVFCGAGGFERLAFRWRFTLSPRARFLTRDVSEETTHNRGLLNTRDEPLCGAGYSRLHLVCGETLRSQRASFLKVGTTALVVAMIQGGLAPGRKVALPNGAMALRRFAADPTCRVKNRCLGGEWSAVEIQRHYLELAESHARDDFMPDWTVAVCREWRSVLDRLGQGAPDSVANELDWAIKHALFRQHVRKQGAEWKSFETSGGTAPVFDPADGDLPFPEADLTRATTRYLQQFLRGEDRDEAPVPPVVPLRTASASRTFSHARLEQELFEIDARFSQLGDQGLFQQLDAGGVLNHRVDGVKDIESAMRHPPTSGRAHVRGEAIRRALAEGRRMRADWDRVIDEQDGKAIDLADPFVTREKWISPGACRRPEFPDPFGRRTQRRVPGGG